MIRLGDGTAESHARAQAAVDELWDYTGEMFECDETEQALVADGTITRPATVRSAWDRTVNEVLSRATLTRPPGEWMQSGGRSGRHSEHLGHLLSVMQHVPRTYTGARW